MPLAKVTLVEATAAEPQPDPAVNSKDCVPELAWAEVTEKQGGKLQLALPDSKPGFMTRSVPSCCAGANAVNPPAMALVAVAVVGEAG